MIAITIRSGTPSRSRTVEACAGCRGGGRRVSRLRAGAASSGGSRCRLPDLHGEDVALVFKHYTRAHLAKPAALDKTVFEAVQRAVFAGDTDWITNKQALANVVAA
ncbi:hypothetical protein WN990_01280 [Kitasatospora purpeofusca]|uniref:hypothetical protein n=1 Tax=Kitasatospora purpeofusca TaxID=67352 RepID=UPI0030F2ED47